MEDKKLLNTQEAAEFLGMGVSTLEQARVYGHLAIPYVRIGSRTIRYRLEDLEQYVQNLKPRFTTSPKEG